MNMTRVFLKRAGSLGLGNGRRHKLALAALFGVYAILATTIYLLAGLGDLAPSFELTPRDFALVIGFFFLPSLAEELLWRWTLIPPEAFSSRVIAVRSVLLSTIAFTAAHPLAATLFVPHAWDLFSRPAFLAIVFLLGLTCGTAYVTSRSIWPPVLIHWLTVLAWKFLLGGPFVMLGR